MAETFNTNLPSVGFHFLQQIGASVTKSGFSKTVQQNPFYPSLFSLSDTFDKYNMPNTAFKIEAEKLADIPAPFIAYIDTESKGDDFVSVISNKNNKVVYTYNGKKEVTTDLNDFKNIFRDIIFMAELNSGSGEDDYKRKRGAEIIHQRLKALFILFGCIALFAVAWHTIKTSSLVLPVLSIFIIILFGLFFSTLLLIYEIDKSNTFVQNICTGGNVKANCNAVLESKGSGLLGISWSEYGFFMFSFLFLAMIAPVTSFHDKLPLFAFVFLISSFYIPFSIYYQYKVVKQWCTLCLAVQIVLFAGLFWALFTFWFKETYIPAFTLSSAFGIVACLFFPVGSWFFLKPLLLKAKDADTFSSAHKRLLYNPDIFKGILEQQPAAPDGWQHLGIDIGSENAQNTIIKVCNPYCGPCAIAHALLDQIIEQNEDVRLKIIFNVTNAEEDKSSKPVKHMLALSERKNQSTTKQALDDWYKSPVKDYIWFSERHPLNGNLGDQNSKIDGMREWCKEAQITFTPTIFINGWRLPEMYDLQELKDLLV